MLKFDQGFYNIVCVPVCVTLTNQAIVRCPGVVELFQQCEKNT
jgi:hypothetical protein